MNGAILLLFAAAWLIVAYLWYGKRTIQRRLMDPLDGEGTPAVTRNDGVDFCPAHPMVLFGHHFSSIAGAGPIVGPIIAAAAFGWGPALLWPLLGGVFIGAVHDYLALMVSVRHGGTSIPDIADRYVSRRARLLFMLFVELALILVVAVFAAITAKMFVTTPEIVIPTFGAIPVAMVFGLFQYRWSGVGGPLWLRTLLAFGALVGLIYVGFLVPFALPLDGEIAYAVWFVALMVYGYFASILPVWILLQPRDYISSWVLIVGTALALIGIVVTMPDMSLSLTGDLSAAVGQKLPFFFRWSDPEVGPLVPFLFIVIACGAISGFHSIIAGGTTSKQLANEKDALLVSFGAMLTESLIAVIAVIAAAGALFWVGEGSLTAVMKSGSPIGVFGAGFGKFTEFLFGPKIGVLVGIAMINIFVMTTLDTTVRLGRFLTVEMAGEVFPILKRNRHLATLVPIIPSFLLGVSGGWKTVWPVFGAANQLVGALVFVILTSYLYSRGKPIRFTLWATLFMLLMTIGALLLLAWGYFFGSPPQYVLGSISVALIFLALLMAIEGVKLFSRVRSSD
ncbi:MAG TPA: carbon starvation protein A [bacterium]|nr:carbon starvation protein A [bacterium]